MPLIFRWPACFPYWNDFQIHQWCYKWQNCLIWKAEQDSLVCICHIFSSLLCADRYLRLSIKWTLQTVPSWKRGFRHIFDKLISCLWGKYSQTVMCFLVLWVLPYRFFLNNGCINLFHQENDIYWDPLTALLKSDCCPVLQRGNKTDTNWTMCPVSPIYLLLHIMLNNYLEGSCLNLRFPQTLAMSSPTPGNDCCSQLALSLFVNPKPHWHFFYQVLDCSK